MKHFGLIAEIFTLFFFISLLLLLQPWFITPAWILVLLACLLLSRLLITIPQHNKHRQAMCELQYQQTYQLLQNATSWFRKILAHLGISPIRTHLILAANQSGKTQLLDGCKLLHNTDEHFAVYQKKRHLLIDTPGIHAIETSRWMPALFQTLRACHATHPLQSIILAIDVNALDAPITQQILDLICQLSQDTFTVEKRPCIQIMITKCDKLTQFLEQFGALKGDEREGLFGLLFKQNNVLSNPEQSFNKRFSQLTDHVAEFIQDKHAPLLLDFQNLHADLLKLTITCSEHHIYLRNICFSSTSTQPPLFANEWLTQAQVPTISPKQFIRYHTFAALLSMISLLGYNAWRIISTNQAQLSQIEQELHEPLATHNPVLLTLDHLAKANALSNELPSPPVKLKSLITFEQDIAHRYQSALNSSFKPWIKQQLESELGQLSSKTIKDFSVYMMLCDDRSRDDEAITEWFDLYWQTHFSPLEQLSAKQHLHALLAKPTLCSLNHGLIEKAQQYLGKIPQEDLTLALTQEEVNKQFKKTDQSAKEGQDNAMYTYHAFHHVYDKALVTTYETLMKYKQQEKSEAILARTRNRYIEKYQTSWQNTFSNIQIPSFNSLSQADHVLNHLQHAPKSLSTQLGVILANTHHPEDQDFQNKIKSPIGTYPMSNEKLVTKLDTWLAQLHQYISHLNQTKRTKRLAFEASKNRMLNPHKDALTYLKQQAKDFPAPIAVWLNQLAQQTWQSMLSETLDYLNNEWQSNILPIYQSLIENKYPLFADSANDMSVDAFQHFFEPNGVLATFMDEKLGPFLQKDKSGWVWKKTDGASLGASPRSADMLMKADAIKTMFFDLNNPKSALLQWQLQPDSFSNDLSSLKILGSQQALTLTNENLKKHAIHITIPMKAPSITITFTNNHQITRSQVFQGPWAWLRAMQHAHPKILHDGKTTRFKLTFKSMDAEAKMTASTQLAMNPLTRGILDGFRCPKHL